MKERTDGAEEERPEASNFSMEVRTAKVSGLVTNVPWCGLRFEPAQKGGLVGLSIVGHALGCRPIPVVDSAHSLSRQSAGFQKLTWNLWKVLWVGVIPVW